MLLCNWIPVQGEEDERSRQSLQCSKPGDPCQIGSDFTHLCHHSVSDGTCFCVMTIINKSLRVGQMRASVRDVRFATYSCSDLGAQEGPGGFRQCKGAAWVGKDTCPHSGFLTLTSPTVKIIRMTLKRHVIRQLRNTSLHNVHLSHLRPQKLLTRGRIEDLAFLANRLSHRGPPPAIASLRCSSSSLPRPYIRSFGSTTGSGSTELVVWCA